MWYNFYRIYSINKYKCGENMLKRNFINNIKRGLGSAFIELSNAFDKEEYRESLVYCITHNCT